LPTRIFLKPFHNFVQFSVRISRTRANYWTEFVIDSLLSVAMITTGIIIHPSEWPLIIGTLLAGLLIFSFIEYFFHRWPFHTGHSVLAQGHAAHHQNPLGYDALPFYLPAVIFSVLFFLFALFIPWSYAFLLVGAMTLGYILYGSCHFIIHHYRFKSKALRHWAALHHIHHVHPDKNFGVTTPLWDILLNTRYISRRNR
jgi:4-hydroxysphinganine ceramide fatty acyl 2-hydroxylase